MAKASSGHVPPGHATTGRLVSTTARKQVLQQSVQAPRPKAPIAIDLAHDSGPEGVAADPPPRPPASAGAAVLTPPISAQAQAPKSITGSQPREGPPLPPLKPGLVAEAGGKQLPDSTAGAGPDGRQAGAANSTHSARKRPRRPAGGMHSHTSTPQVLPSSKLLLLLGVNVRVSPKCCQGLIRHQSESMVVMKSQTLATYRGCYWYTRLQPPGSSALRLQLPCWLAAHAHPVLKLCVTA